MALSPSPLAGKAVHSFAVENSRAESEAQRSSRREARYDLPIIDDRITAPGFSRDRGAFGSDIEGM
jgi:hypothetical protein